MRTSFVAASLSVASIGIAALAEPVAIVNPSFEVVIPPLGPGGFRNMNPANTPGWELAGGGSSAGVFRPLPTQAIPTDGLNVAWSNTATFRQVLEAAAEPDMIYTLEVDVGRRLDTGSPGALIQLRAGQILLGQVTVPPSALPQPGSWTTATIQVVTCRALQPGQQLEIRMSAPAVQTIFDRVRLDASPNPNPCRADYDFDCFVTGADFDAFVLDFELGSPSADFDVDGFITGLDFDAFVVAFEEGC